VVADNTGDDWGMVVRVDKGEIVRAHLRETVGVLVDEGCLEDGVNRPGRTELHGSLGLAAGTKSLAIWRVGLVLRVVGAEGLVADSEEEDLDRVREANIETGGGVRYGVECLPGGGLYLFNEDIAGGTGHALTLIVGNNGVVGPYIDVGESGNVNELCSRGNGALLHTAVGVGGGNEEIIPVTEHEGDTHVVVGEGSSGEGDTRVTTIEEWEGEVEGGLGELDSGQNEWADVTDHVLVTFPLASGNSEGSPEVKVVAIKTSSDKVVECNGTLLDEVVHEVLGPAKVLHSRKNEGHLWDGDTKPSLEEIVTGAGDGNRPLVAEVGTACGLGEAYWDLGEPSGLTGFAYEIGGGISPTIEVFLDLVEGGEINEPGGYVG